MLAILQWYTLCCSVFETIESTTCAHLLWIEDDCFHVEMGFEAAYLWEALFFLNPIWQRCNFSEFYKLFGTWWGKYELDWILQSCDHVITSYNYALVQVSAFDILRPKKKGEGLEGDCGFFRYSCCATEVVTGCILI